MSWGFELDQRQRKFFKVGDLDAASAISSMQYNAVGFKFENNSKLREMRSHCLP